MKIHKLTKIYNNVDAFITPSEFLKNKLIVNGFDKNKIMHLPTFTSPSENNDNIIGDLDYILAEFLKKKV